MNRGERGIALITTLIMLSVVTLMAVAFLAVARRERTAVSTSSDRVDAKAMAEAARQRAEAEVVSRVLATTNLLSYDLLVTTNFINPAGFVRGNTNVANVSYVDGSGTALAGTDLLEMYRNLQVDARAPVFVVTNAATGEEDFRYFLDFNRNGLYETNGVQFELDRNGRPLGFTNFHVGDPEWIGVLRRPDLPHSGTNLFVGRLAYIIQPAGKTLDLNYIHNQVKRLGPDADGFFRNQGVGSWELNLAAFLRELNTNAWTTYLYLTNSGNLSSGFSFYDARTILRRRYRLTPTDAAPTYQNLRSIRDLFGVLGANVFDRDGIDGYGDGALQLDVGRPYNVAGGVFDILDNDVPTLPWPGAENPSQYFDPQELFGISEPGPLANQFTNRLIQASIGRATYDRHTFYRLLGQLGTDSVPASRTRVHLNYDNRLDFDPVLAGAIPGPDVGFHATNFVAWQPVAFFTNAANAILKKYFPPSLFEGSVLATTNRPTWPTNLSLGNIPIWPTNLYTPTVHRSLQLAANIYDATTNRPGLGYPHFPSIFRPVFTNAAGGVAINRYADISDIDPNALWSVLPKDIDEDQGRVSIAPFDLVAGVPLIVGAKKGWPNFNEFALQTVVQATRKLELVKPSPLARPNVTNQLYTLGISNLFGVEFWNSYTQAFPRPLELRVRVEVEMVLSNEVRVVRSFGPATLATNIIYGPASPAGAWRGQEFKLPISTTFTFLPDSIYRSDGVFLSLSNRFQSPFEPARGFPIPTWRLSITNRIQAMLIDRDAGRVVDYVNLDNMNSVIDVTSALFGQEDAAGQTSLIGSFWQTNRVGGIPEGVRNQIQASLGSINVAEWNSAAAEPIQGQDKEKAVDRFRQFVGLAGQPVPPSPTLRMQVPFSPGRKLFQNKAWQVNDPLVNRLYWDLEDSSRTNDIRYVKPVRAPIGSDTHNLGQINYRYRPWQRSLYSSADPTDFAVAVKDPQVSRSDDWDFPTNTLPSIGWLGRVHRGTPWQTVYLKSEAIGDVQWTQWSGHPNQVWRGFFLPGTQPTNDWRLLDLFTTSISENASRGLLSVNQSGQAAWAAVLGGVPVLTNLVATNVGPAIIEPNTLELRIVVDGINAARRTRFGQRFNYLGEILSTPQLTVASPYLVVAPSQLGTPADAVVERIPQMILSLLKPDEPRFVVYAYGQSLRPAPGSAVTDLGPFFQMPTNYMITGEYVTKTLMRLEPVLEFDPASGLTRTRIISVTENYNEVPPTE